MRKFKISYGKRYQDQQGQEKTSWKTLGYANEIVSQDGKTTIHGEFDSVPPNWNGEFKLFLQDEQQDQPQQNQQRQREPQRPQQGYGKEAPVHYEQAPQGRR